MKRTPGDVLITDEELALYGHLSVQEFVDTACQQGFWDEDSELDEERLLRVWYRWVPAAPGDDYKMWAFPAKPHTRGAFPATVYRY